MANYYNPYNFFPATYPQQYSTAVNPQLSPTPGQQGYSGAPAMKPMEWVEGEVGAKAFQMPQGWPANQPIPLWDSTDTVIYLKSWSQMGIPNPMQKLKYELPQQNQQMLQSGNISGQQENAQGSNAMTKEEFDKKFEELRTDFQHMIDEMKSTANRGAGK